MRCGETRGGLVEEGVAVRHDEDGIFAPHFYVLAEFLKAVSGSDDVSVANRDPFAGIVLELAA